MSRTPTPVNRALHDYLIDVGVDETAVQSALRDHTDKLPNAGMQVSPDAGAFLAMLVRMLDARTIVEVGTFTGYSTLCMALALPADGCIIACDISAEYTDQAKPYWQQANVAGRIDLRIAPALDTLAELVDSDLVGTVDFAFIDADKENYEAYYEHCLTLLRPGGVIAVDNVLWGGAAIRGDDTSPSTRAIRAFNDARRTDDRVERVMLTIADGITLLRKSVNPEVD